jgi:hypothetical protein
MFKAVSNLLGSQQEKKSFAITPELIRSVIDEIEADPYAGLGAISKKAMLVDRLCALFRMHDCLARGVPVTQPRPILNEPSKEPAQPSSGVTVSKPAAKPRVEATTPTSVPVIAQKALDHKLLELKEPQV